jgi:V8-like Glu-specific endopeptidase
MTRSWAVCNLLVICIVLVCVCNSFGLADELSNKSPSTLSRPATLAATAATSSNGAAQRPSWIAPVDEKRLAREAASLRNNRPLYTPESRKNLWEIDDDVVTQQAIASVALFRSSDFDATPEGTQRLHAKTFKDVMLLCPDERFANELQGAFCSGLLVTNDTVLTAGHCVNELQKDSHIPTLADIRFVFGFSVDSSASPGRGEFSKQQFYRAKAPAGNHTSITDSTLSGKASSATREDWALIKLEAPVPPDVADPITNAAHVKIANGTDVYALGFPSGIPLKYATAAQVSANASKFYFMTNLNTFDGNSGSGVFSGYTNDLVGILTSGEPQDFYWDSEAACSRPYYCSRNGCTGEAVTRIEMIPLGK